MKIDFKVTLILIRKISLLCETDKILCIVYNNKPLDYLKHDSQYKFQQDEMSLVISWMYVIVR